MNELFESSYLSAMSEMNNKLREKNQKLQSNWNSLREWLKYEYLLFDNESDERRIASEILDKMNELEGKDK